MSPTFKGELIRKWISIPKLPQQWHRRIKKTTNKQTKTKTNKLFKHKITKHSPTNFYSELGLRRPPSSTSSGALFSKVPIINGPVKLLLFTCKIEVSIVLHLTWQNYQLLKQNGVFCWPGPALLFFILRTEYLISGPKSYRDFAETGPRPVRNVYWFGSSNACSFSGSQMFHKKRLKRCQWQNMPEMVTISLTLLIFVNLVSV